MESNEKNPLTINITQEYSYLVPPKQEVMSVETLDFDNLKRQVERINYPTQLSQVVLGGFIGLFVSSGVNLLALMSQPMDLGKTLCFVLLGGSVVGIFCMWWFIKGQEDWVGASKRGVQEAMENIEKRYRRVTLRVNGSSVDTD